MAYGMTRFCLPDAKINPGAARGSRAERTNWMWEWRGGVFPGFWPRRARISGFDRVGGCIHCDVKKNPRILGQGVPPRFERVFLTTEHTERHGKERVIKSSRDSLEVGIAWGVFICFWPRRAQIFGVLIEFVAATLAT